jgi:hypothetical protein
VLVRIARTGPEPAAGGRPRTVEVGVAVGGEVVDGDSAEPSASPPEQAAASRASETRRRAARRITPPWWPVRGS